MEGKEEKLIFTDEDIKDIHILAGMAMQGYLSQSKLKRSEEILSMYSYDIAECMILEKRERNIKYKNQIK